jgi:hypothetical protein
MKIDREYLENYPENVLKNLVFECFDMLCSNEVLFLSGAQPFRVLAVVLLEVFAKVHISLVFYYTITYRSCSGR